MSTAIQHAADRAAHEPEFIAHDLDIVARRGGYTRDDIAACLGLTGDRFAELALCRSPRRDERFWSDLTEIASFSKVDARQLARLIREADALAALATSPNTVAAPVLAAAREKSRSTSRPEAKGNAMQPGWLTEAVDVIWGEELSGAFPRDIELAVLWRLPLAIVELQHLTGSSVMAWLQHRGIDLPVHTPPKRLKGALVAFAGSGVLFLDVDDDPSERRVTIAHEAGHFAVDYWLPRVRLAKRAPQLLAVVDGLREPAPEDQIDALLARIPFGVHTHLFEREERATHLDPAIAASENRANQIAWELLAPLAKVADDAQQEDDFSLIRNLESGFGLPRATAREYASHVRRTLGTKRAGRNFNWD